MRRLRRRERYATYIESVDSYGQRVLWYADHLRLTSAEPVCAVCEKPWRLHDGDLHHASYERLGHERSTDLIPLCRDHHQAVHDLWDASPSWRRLSDARATAGIIAALRRNLHQPARVVVREHTA